MKMNLLRSLVIGLVILCYATYLPAKSQDPGQGPYSTTDLEYYLSTEDLLFIRPGLVIEILDVVIPADSRLEVTYSITDPGGLPLDHFGETTPGVVDMRYVVAHIPLEEEQKVRLAYERNSRDGTLTANGDGVYTYKFDAALSANPDTTHTLVLGGRRDLRDYYLDRYADNAVQDWVPSGLGDPMPRDVVTTQTCNRCHDPLAIHGSRWQEVTACSQCHNPVLVDDEGVSHSLDVMIHRVHIGLEDGYPAEIHDCEVCHTGGTPTKNFPLVANPANALVCDSSGSGETTLTWQHTADVEIRIRSSWDAEGELFIQGGPTGSEPTGKQISDGTLFDIYDSATMKLLQTLPVNTTVLGCTGNAPGTFRGSAGVQHSNWLDHSSRLVCGSCHADVNFETGEGHSIYNLVQPDDTRCGNCHEPYTVGAQVAQSAQASSPQVEGLNGLDTIGGPVKSSPAGKGKLNALRPNVPELDTGINMLVQKNGASPEVNTGDNSTSSVNAISTTNVEGFYNNEEYDWSIRGAHTVLYKSVQFPGVLIKLIDIQDTNPGDTPTVTFSVGSKYGPIDPADLNRLRLSLSGPNDDFSFFAQETVGASALPAGDNWTYTFETPLPADATGSYTVSAEGRNVVTIDMGIVESEERDQAQNPLMAFAVTDMEDTPRRSVVDDYKCENCHSNLDFHGRNRHDPDYCNICHRPEALDRDGMQTIHLKYMVHSIHRGEDLENGFTVGGQDYSELEYPGDLRNCDACHVGNSQQLPLPSGLLSTFTPLAWWSPMMPQSAACLSCHDGDDVAAHAFSNTTFFGEACSTCHGEGKSVSVDRVHAR